MDQITRFLVDQIKALITLDPVLFFLYLVLPLAVIHAMYGKYSERKEARAQRLAIARARYADSVKKQPIRASESHQTAVNVQHQPSGSPSSNTQSSSLI